MSVCRRWNFYEFNIMEAQQDFKELLALLNEHKVEYVIVGGYALAFQRPGANRARP
jgi:RNase H-fold protein (predicted Holliday junction resolvase)